MELVRAVCLRLVSAAAVKVLCDLFFFNLAEAEAKLTKHGRSQ